MLRTYPSLRNHISLPLLATCQQAAGVFVIFTHCYFADLIVKLYSPFIMTIGTPLWSKPPYIFSFLV